MNESVLTRPARYLTRKGFIISKRKDLHGTIVSNRVRSFDSDRLIKERMQRNGFVHDSNSEALLLLNGFKVDFEYVQCLSGYAFRNGG